MPYRILRVVGAIGDLGLIWLVADVMNGLMALPNLVALLLLSPVVFRISRAYFGEQRAPATP